MKYFMGFTAFFFVLCGNAPGSVWYVDIDNVSGTEDGTSWATAFTSIQPAVDAASTAGGGEVWAAEGTYISTTNPVVTMKANVNLYGGFASTETNHGQRDWQAHITTIDGENARRCVNGTNAAIDGFAITHGYSGEGGGMYNSDSSPVVKNCILWGDAPTEIYNASSTCNSEDSCEPGTASYRWLFLSSGLSVTE